MFNKTCFKRSSIQIMGKHNQITFHKCYLNKTNILVVGNNNFINIDSDAKINSTHIIMRGNNCKVTIGKGSTFGSAYMVCMGINKYINIGEECMFADNIDIWCSDSHPIFNTEGKLINPSSSISIGNHVWCGKWSKILKGTTIGDNSVIGMGALVTKDIAPGTLNVGVPAHTIKEAINWNRNFITE